MSSESGGRVVFARLPWPGYRVTLGGNDVGYDDVDGIFLTVDVPAGTRDADLVVTWRPPGMYLGMGSALAGLLGIAALTVLYRRSRRNDEVARDPLSIV